MNLVDKETLTSHDAWLSDAVIKAAQTLPKFLSGLTWKLCCIYRRIHTNLHNGRDHWNVISTIGVKHPIVNIFYSLYCSCTIHTKLQIAGLLSLTEPAIKLQYVDVQKRVGQG